MTNAVEPAPSDSSLRLTDAISLGVLAEVVGRDLIEDVLDEAGRREQRTRRLPAHVMVRFCLAMCLFYDDDYEEVMRKLVGSLKEMDSWRDGWQVPTTSAITQARQRLTEEPLRMLFERTATPVAGRGTKGGWLGARRLMAVDGFMLDVPTPPTTSRSSAAWTPARKPDQRPSDELDRDAGQHQRHHDA